jgi:hypothetical protein
MRRMRLRSPTRNLGKRLRLLLERVKRNLGKIQRKKPEESKKSEVVAGNSSPAQNPPEISEVPAPEKMEVSITDDVTADNSGEPKKSTEISEKSDNLEPDTKKPEIPEKPSKTEPPPRNRSPKNPRKMKRSSQNQLLKKFMSLEMASHLVKISLLSRKNLVHLKVELRWRSLARLTRVSTKNPTILEVKNSQNPQTSSI